MSRQEVYYDIEKTIGKVPSFFKTIPDQSLEMEWNLMKQMQLQEGAIPPKYRHLIGIGISAATKCRYCAFFHIEAAKLNGATEEEIEDAVHFAKNSAGWSTYLNGLQFDFAQYQNEVLEMADYIRKQQKVEA